MKNNVNNNVKNNVKNNVNNNADKKIKKGGRPSKNNIPTTFNKSSSINDLDILMEHNRKWGKKLSLTIKSIDFYK